VFEEQYNKIVDSYAQSVKGNQSSQAIKEALTVEDVSPDMAARKQGLRKNQPIHQSQPTLKKAERLVNVLEEKPDYLVISPPRINR